MFTLISCATEFYVEKAEALWGGQQFHVGCYVTSQSLWKAPAKFNLIHRAVN